MLVGQMELKVMMLMRSCESENEVAAWPHDAQKEGLDVLGSVEEAVEWANGLIAAIDSARQHPVELELTR